MARKSLSGLVDALPEARPAETPPARTAPAGVSPETREPAPPARPPREPAATKPRRRPQPKVDVVHETEARPFHLTLARKEARLREDQADELALLTRRINRARDGAGERITDNTLIRVAVDLLLERRGSLAGATEDELRRSVGL